MIYKYAPKRTIKIINFKLKKKILNTFFHHKYMI